MRVYRESLADWIRKFFALFAAGYRNDAVSILSREVMVPRGLIGLGKDTLDVSVREMRELFEMFAEPSTYPVVIHCTQGKDRTGLIITLLLLLTGVVPVEAMADDYVRSETELLPEMEERMKEIKAIGLDESYVKCPAGFTQAIKDYIDSKHGGVETYLLSVGVSQELQEKVRSMLLA